MAPRPGRHFSIPRPAREGSGPCKVAITLAVIRDLAREAKRSAIQTMGFEPGAPRGRDVGKGNLPWRLQGLYPLPSRLCSASQRGPGARPSSWPPRPGEGPAAAASCPVAQAAPLRAGALAPFGHVMLRGLRGLRVLLPRGSSGRPHSSHCREG